jgi:hypothetical protein
MIPAQMNRQRDFTGGEVKEDAARRDDTIAKVSARTLRNWRILNSGGFEERPGRRALLARSSGARFEDISPEPDIAHTLSFTHDRLSIYDDTGTEIFTQTAMPWSVGNIRDVSWTYFNRRLIVAAPDGRPREIEWDGSGWTYLTGGFQFLTEASGRKAEPFWRFAPAGVTIYYTRLGADTLPGSDVTLHASAATFTADHVGSIIRYANQQMLVTGYTSSTVVTAEIIEELPAVVEYTVEDTSGFNAGDVIIGDLEDAQAIILAVVSPTVLRMVFIKNFASGFGVGENVVGPTARTPVNGAGATYDTGSTTATTYWDESMMSLARGWPQSVSSDQNRLIFTDFMDGSISDCIAWSHINTHNDFAVGADADDAMVEIVPGKKRVLFVVGMMGDEFVFTEKGVYSIPISVSNPLKPGNVDFRQVTSGGAARVQPAVSSDALIYVATGNTHIESIVATGQNTRPYVTRNVSAYHEHLFETPIAVGVLAAGGVYIEEYVYVANADGTMAVGKASPDKEWIGWVPWDGSGEVFWVSGAGTRLVITTVYGDSRIAELLDESLPLDAVVLINDVPAQIAATAPVGMGPLWPWEGPVQVYDGEIPLGERMVEDGELQAMPGDDFSGANEDVYIGYGWTATFEPFVPHVQPGQSAQQSMRRRKVKRMAVAFQNSTGFVVGNRRVAMYQQGEDQSLPPTQREGVELFRPQGRAYDPRIPLTKDTPGPLRIIEVGLDVTA